MKKTIYSFVAIMSLIIAISGCRKDIYGCTDPSGYNYNAGANTNNGTCTYAVMFWTNVNEGVVTVTIAGQTANITGYVTGGQPNCGNSVSANFYLPAGTYSYTAVAPSSPAYPSGYSISGTAQSISGVCQAYQL